MSARRGIPAAALPFVLAAVAILTAAAAPPPARAGDARRVETAWKREREHWYQLRLNDQACGWMKTEEWRSADGAERRSVNESRVRFGRAGAEIEVTVRVEFDETSAGAPLRCEVLQRSGQEPIEQSYRFDPADRSRATVESRQAGRRSESVVELPREAWLPPLAAEDYAAARRRAGAREYRLLTVDPSAGMKGSEISAQRGDASTFTLDGRAIPTVRWTVRNSLLQVDSTEEWSDDDVMVRSTAALPIGRLESVLSSRADALGTARGPAVELMVRTMVKPDRPIAGVLGTGRARYRLSALEGTMPDLPSIGAQGVTRISPSQVEVSVDDASGAAATDAERDDARFRRASVSVDSDDPAIRDLAAKTLASAEGAAPADRAERLRAAVHRHIRRKGMQSAFASASETVRSQEGDCTEHAMLLAALLRADGIPSRVVSGLVYCPEFAGQRDVFGWHMWTQALLDGRWIDLDATLPEGRRFHAGHIAVGSSAQEQGALDAEWSALVTLIGNIRIEVLETARRDAPAAK